jgi:hypothetical protein
MHNPDLATGVGFDFMDQTHIADERGIVLLSSGQLLKVNGITLYPAERVAEIIRLRELAASKMGGVSTGIGFIGSPGWAIGAGAALGLLQGALSNAARNECVRISIEADRLHLALLRSGTVFPFGQIANRDQPMPSLWRAEMPVTRTVDYRHLSKQQRNYILQTHGKDKSHAVNHMLDFPEKQTFVHDGGEFFTADTETGLMKIRSQNIVGFAIG